MATYNFTVRAKDETGAFADREFNIEVRNTMVDRALAVNAANAYASVDGTNWSVRTGMGGLWCDNLLGKWMIATSDTTYSISEDTLNWTSGLEFRISNDAPVYGYPDAPEEGGEVGMVELQPAGPIYDLPFTFRTKRLVEISGKVYGIALVDGKIGVVYSTDLVKWYLVVAENFVSTDNNYFGLPNAAIDTDLRSWTTFEKHNGQFVVYNGATKQFIVSDDMVSFATIQPANHSVMDWIYHATNERDHAVAMKSLNGILFIQYSTVSGGPGGYARFRYPRSLVYYTIDLNNISIPANNQYAQGDARGSDGIIPFNPIYYNNGILYHLSNTGKAYLDRPTQMTNHGEAVSVRDATVFDGEMLVIGSGKLHTVDATQALVAKTVNDLPITGLLSVCSM